MRTIRTLGSSTPTRTPLTRQPSYNSKPKALWRRIAGIDRCNISTMARETLAAQLNLMDPAWGAVYQYSTDGDWQHPHFEKIMQMQAEDLRIYAIAYALWHDDTYLQAANRIRGYLKNFLTSGEG